MPDDSDDLTCDRNGCERTAWARYRHVRTGDWINTCGPDSPEFGRQQATVAGCHIYEHSRRHPEYPAQRPSEVINPNAFKRRVDRNA